MYPPQFYILAIALIVLGVAIPNLISSLKRRHTNQDRK